MDSLQNPVRITAEARDQIIDTLSANKIPDTYGLRVGVRGGGCGTSWLLGFDEPGTADEVYLVEGVQVIIDKKHLLYVLGTEVGYEYTTEGSGFTIQKANDRP